MASRRTIPIQDIILLVIIIAILISIIILLRKTIESFADSAQPKPQPQPGNIPKTIWTYWDDPVTIPRTVRFCMESWKKHNPDYTIRLLTKNSYTEFVDIPKAVVDHPNMNDMKQRFADLVRCYVLAKHGGVWVDSSILMNRPLDSWLFEKSTSADLYGFTISSYTAGKGKYPVLENWFFAVPQNSSFIRSWRDEFSKITEFSSVKEYVDSRIAMGLQLEGWTDPYYLAMHVAAQKLLQIDRFPVDRLSLWKSEDGPFRYLAESNWDADKGLVEACANPSIRGQFMKLRGHDRSRFEAGFDAEFANTKCKWM